MDARSAPEGGAPGVRRISVTVRWTVTPPNGRATDGAPRPFKRSRIAKRRKARITIAICFFLFSFLFSLFSPSAYAAKENKDQPVYINAHSIEHNEKTGVTLYRGDVSLKQGNIQINADRLIVRTRNNETEFIEAYGNPVTFHERLDNEEGIHATASRAEYDAIRKLLDLYGEVSFRQGGDVFNGRIAHYNMNEKRLSARGDAVSNGRVFAVIRPDKQSSQPSPVP